MNRLLEHFTNGTGCTGSGASVGIEIETQFANADGEPISTTQTDALLGAEIPGCSVKLELGRQMIELNVAPESNFNLLWGKTRRSLDELYAVARRLGCVPVFAPTPFANWSDPLLYVQEERDAVWVALDGEWALEHLCRCSSVQFTIDVNPTDAIGWINRLWQARFHEGEYTGNDVLWRRYIAESHFGYRSDRYGGPEGFEDLGNYVAHLAEHKVVMHQGTPCRKSIADVLDLNIDLFLRSIWWHYRLRRYGDSLTIEIRPFPREEDEEIPRQWVRVADVLGL